MYSNPGKPGQEQAKHIIEWMSIQFIVLGVIVTLEGQTKGYQLVNTLNEAPEKVLYDISFEVPKTSLPITTVLSEEQVSAFLNRPGAFQVIQGRVKLPRIICGPVYWPPSKRALGLLQERWHASQTGETSELQTLDW